MSDVYSDAQVADLLNDALDHEKVAAWLLEVGAAEAGEVQDNATCPLARYLDATVPEIRSTSGVDYFEASGEYYAPNGGVETVAVPLPAWARWFVHLADLEREEGQSLTGNECLVILGKARRRALEERATYLDAVAAEQARVQMLYEERMAVALETPDGLRAWLESLHPDERAGDSCSANRCPVAMYLRKTVTYPLAAEVGLEEWQAGVKVNAESARSVHGSMVEMPRWGVRFIARVDNYTGEAVPAREALALLDAAMEEVG